MQKTNFPFEIIVHDDASLDHTSEIIREYETKYPSIIKPIIEEENLYSRDLLLFRLIMVKHINTKYVIQTFCNNGISDLEVEHAIELLNEGEKDVD